MPHAWKVGFNRTIYVEDIGGLKYESIVSGALQLLEDALNLNIMWQLRVMSVSGDLVNAQFDIMLLIPW